MKKIELLLLLMIMFTSPLLQAQQVADTLFNPVITHPAYVAGSGPVVFIDEGHHNFHTLSGRYKPFARVLMKDGYNVQPLTGFIHADALPLGKILVIANAVHENNIDNWSLPTSPAFTDEEVTTINRWVEKGGSLFLIADHMPFPGAAENLAASFSVTFYNGFARKKKNNTGDIFTLQEGGLVENPLIKGRNQNEKVTSVMTFTGQGFQIPKTAQPILVLNEDYEVLLPETAWQFNVLTKSVPGTNLVQGAYMKYGKGRVVIFGEAAAFTAQRQGSAKFGMNAPGAEQNTQFLLNIIHWPDGLID